MQKLEKEKKLLQMDTKMSATGCGDGVKIGEELRNNSDNDDFPVEEVESVEEEVEEGNDVNIQQCFCPSCVLERCLIVLP